MTTASMIGLSAAFELVTLGCKCEVLVLVSSCYMRLGTACYCEVWLTVGQYRVPTVETQCAAFVVRAEKWVQQ